MLLPAPKPAPQRNEPTGLLEASQRKVRELEERVRDRERLHLPLPERLELITGWGKSRGATDKGDVRARIREGWLTAQKAETGRVSLKFVGGSATGRKAAEDTPSSSRRKSVTLFLGTLLQARDAPAELAA